MPTDNFVRLINLYGLLLQATEGDPATTSQIAEAVTYDDYRVKNGRWNLSNDRADLVGMGIPVREGPTSTGAPGWWIPQDELFKAGLPLDADERAALGRATRAIDFRDALWARVARTKIGATGGSSETVALFVAPKALPGLQEARANRSAVRIRYRGQDRSLQPWGIGNSRGHWYLVGPPAGAPAGTVPKVFRVDLMDETKTRQLGPDTSIVPDDFNIEDHLPSDLFGWGDELLEVRVAVDREVAFVVGRAVGDRLTMTERPDGRSELAFTCNHRGVLVSWALSIGPRAEVLAPSEVRTEIVDRLEAMVAAHGS